MLVSGRENEYCISGYKKAYAKVKLDSFSGSARAEIVLNVSGDNYGEIYIYGIKDAAEAQYWNSGTINYLNAPANDRFGFGANPSKVYDASAIAKVYAPP